MAELTVQSFVLFFYYHGDTMSRASLITALRQRADSLVKAGSLVHLKMIKPGDRKRLWAATGKASNSLAGQFSQSGADLQLVTKANWQLTQVISAFSLDSKATSSHHTLQGDISVLNFLLGKYSKRQSNALTLPTHRILFYLYCLYPLAVLMRGVLPSPWVTMYPSKI